MWEVVASNVDHFVGAHELALQKRCIEEISSDEPKSGEGSECE